MKTCWGWVKRWSRMNRIAVSGVALFGVVAAWLICMPTVLGSMARASQNSLVYIDDNE